MLTKLIGEWWEQEDIPEEVIEANVALVFKSGDSCLPENYRPISLLTVIYKTVARILCAHIQNKIDPQIQKAQFGFRKNRSTGDAIHCMRRLLSQARAASEPNVLLLLLGWSKAFDKVSHEALCIALERLNIPNKLVNMIKALYKNIRFRVKIDGQTSDLYKQETGIRQGCPLSPYLFNLIMTVAFHDIKMDAYENSKKCKRQD